jgi:AbrB family looped-hinge helix DNA binding protein
MQTITVSPKFQVVIPRLIRESLNITPGQLIQAVQYGNRIELIPMRNLKSARGFLGKLDTKIKRDADRV